MKTITFEQLKRLVKESEENETPGYEILSIDKTDLMSQSSSGVSYYYDVIVSVNGKKRRIPVQAKNDEEARRKAESRIEIGYKMGELEEWGSPVQEAKGRRANESKPITLTLGQLKRLIKEATDDSDFKIEDGVLVDYHGKGGDVVIPDGVTRIGLSAFEDCSDLTSVTIPARVTNIEEYAFYGCTGLKSVTIPDYSSLREIEGYAFGDCTSLTYIKIPKSVKVVRQMAFDRCDKLDIATVQRSTNIEYGAFPEHTVIEEF